MAQVNNARAQTGEDPIEVNLDAAPESVKAEQREAKRREDVEEAARINEETSAIELETARLHGRLEAMKEGK